MLAVNGGSRHGHLILEGQERLVIEPSAARDITDEQDDEECDEGEADESGESDDYHGIG